MEFDKHGLYFHHQITLPSDDVWIPANESVSVAGRDIGGMVYTGKRLDGTYNKNSDSVIDPSLPVNQFTNPLQYGFSLGRTPWRYCCMDPFRRALYLEWLASGRSVEGFDDSYICLYFFGLERRFFLDSPSKKEQRMILSEAKRLLRIYKGKHKGKYAERRLIRFIQTAIPIVSDETEIKPRFQNLRFGGRPSLDLSVAIKRFINANGALNAEWYLVLYAMHPKTKFPAGTRRVFPEFRALFKHFFDKEFPNGLSIPMTNALIHPIYEAKEQQFSVDLSRYFGKVPDLTSIYALENQVMKMIDKVSDQLTDYRRYKSTAEGKNFPMKAFKLLPSSIRSQFTPVELKNLKNLIESAIRSKKKLRLRDLVKAINPDYRFQIQKLQLSRLSESLQVLCYGIIPDYSFEWTDIDVGEYVFVFELPQDSPPRTEVSKEYKQAILCMMAGVMVAHKKDDWINSTDEVFLESYVQSVPLTHEEQLRLSKNLEYMIQFIPTMEWFRQILKISPKKNHHRAAEMALCIAMVNGKAESDQIKMIQKIYKAVGLKPDTIYSDLHAISASGKLETIILEQNQSKHFKVPAPAAPDQPVVLDEEHIASLKSETKQVFTLLGEIFEDQNDSEVDQQDQEESPEIFEGLDQAHSALLTELLARDAMDESEFTGLTSQLKLMKEGALETLNEWSFDQFDDLLIDDHEGFEINPEIRNILQPKDS